ncbi:very short patch repair endonuclease [Neorhizobium galegae]|uniref:very short patch repair endonuclease n=1 Tax=Neorhizobium galegae TaxID=399 RepID=UPI002102C50B|nr:very short patch repair endonuclease [Neorhizobium galegae]MCQ1773703.1 very short patch repair endonuclease [Neorhizobium galegae]MCQ1799730.1 very short patch repair endonuclease [Neorhizobium galegae]
MTGIDPKRSSLMARVKGKNTKPEMIVRRTLFAMGLRYRIHRKDLPGSPDIVFPGRKKAIFVHGCFWHRHAGCRLASTPKTRVDFWKAKFDANAARDSRNIDALEGLGWSVLVVWQCETSDLGQLSENLKSFLDGDMPLASITDSAAP